MNEWEEEQQKRIEATIEHNKLLLAFNSYQRKSERRMRFKNTVIVGLGVGGGVVIVASVLVLVIVL